MRPRNEVWQGCFGYWQSYFMQQNLLLLGYVAWDGYLNHGRGIVVCEIADTILVSIDWQIERVAFDHKFIPQSQIASYLQASVLEQAVVRRLLQVIATYEPTREIVILIQGNGAIDINLLQPKTTPASCYEQVQRRWTEFQPDLLQPPERSYG